MRIISPFKDCYDGLMSNTQPVYVRETTEENVNDFRCQIGESPTKDSYNLVFGGFIMGFCGEIYYGMKTFKTQYQYECYYSDESLRKSYSDIFQPRWSWKKGNKFDYIPCLHGIPSVLGFGLPEDEKKRFHSFFSPSCPFFIVEEVDRFRYTGKLIRNPSAKQFELYKLFPVQQVFQEIEMYLGGLANPDKNIPHVSDKDMIEAKGFDKFSFRKDKEKK